MACTPHKLVRWAEVNDVNEIILASPYSDPGSLESFNSSSTLQYINSQLIAHGFARPPGLSFEGLAKEDEVRSSKCLLGMLNQRMEDMCRTEELSTKLRTLTYEHERLASIHHTTEEKLAAAERETNLFKSRLAAANKSLQASEAAHKVTSTEMQKCRSSLQSVRQTYAAESKRREKEAEKMIERWAKISESQSKLSSIASGSNIKLSSFDIECNVRDDGDSQKGNELLENAYQEVETARKGLIDENLGLKNIVLSAANELSRMTHAIRKRVIETDDEAPQYSIADLFSLSGPETINDSFRHLLNSFYDVFSQLGGSTDFDSESNSNLLPRTHSAGNKVTKELKDENKDIQQLQDTIADLQKQLEQAQTQKQSGTYADQAQAIIRRFVDGADHGSLVEERKVLEKVRRDLDGARRKVDEAALRLKDEKDTLDEEREAFIQEKRLWKSQLGMPPDDEPLVESAPSGLDAYFASPTEPLLLSSSPARQTGKNTKVKSPRKQSNKSISGSRSPMRTSFAVGKVGMTSSRKGRGSSSKKFTGVSLGASTLKPKVIPPMETEVIPSMILSTKADGKNMLGSQRSIVPTAFVLPPASPLASLPPQQDLLTTSRQTAVPAHHDTQEELTSTTPPDDQGSYRPAHAPDTPSPPAPRSFPVAKPLAQHMIHAYSPARPSPLSRILMLASSSIEAGHNEEETTKHAQDGVKKVDEIYEREKAMSLEEMLGLAESASDESPLREKKLRMSKKTNSKVKNESDKRSKSQSNKRSVKATAIKVSRSGSVEKENEDNTGRLPSTQSRESVFAMKTDTNAAPLGTGKGRARRVPIGSAEAGPVGRGWR